MRSILKTLALVGLLLCGGCTTLTRTTPPVVLAPPDALIQDCAEPAGSVQTNQEMAVYLLDLRDALRGCTVQLRGIRDWIATSKAASQK